MKNYSYYLVTLGDKGIQRNPEFTNRLVVGMTPPEWFAASGWHTDHVLVNFWEITEGTFGEFDHALQNLAWDELYQITGEEIEEVEE